MVHRDETSGHDQLRSAWLWQPEPGCCAVTWKTARPNPPQVLSHGASLRISFATNICLLACFVCALILDGLTLYMGSWEHPLSLIG